MGVSGTSDITMLMRSATNMVNLVAAVQKILLEIAEANRDEKLVNALLEYGKTGGNLDLQICRSFAFQDFDAKLTQYGIPHCGWYDKVTGATVIATRDCDRELVLKAKNELFVEQQRLSRLTPEEFNRLNAGKNIEIVRARSVVEAKIFQQTAQKFGLSNIAFRKNSEDPSKIDIYFTSKDKDRAMRVMDRTVMATVGFSGEMSTAHATREINFQNSQMRAIQDSEKDFYIVSQQNPNEYIHFNKDGLQYYRNGALLHDEPRSNNNFAVIAKAHISSIITPVVFQKSEFEIPEEARAALVKGVKLDVDRSTVDAHRAALEKEAKALIDLKLTLDKVDPTRIPSDFYAPDASFRELFPNGLSRTHEQALQETIERLDHMSDIDRAAIKCYVGSELSTQHALLQDAQNPERDFYVFSKQRPSEYYHFSETGLEHCRGDKVLESYSRSDPQFIDKSHELMRDISSPVSLSKEQFELPRKERSEILKAVPDPMQSQAHLISDLEREARRLVELKLSLDNGNQSQIPSSFYNPNVSFGEFCGIEQINDDDAKEFIAKLDALEDREKGLIKAYVKDTFTKIEEIEVQTAYIDPNLEVDEFTAAIERASSDNEEVALTGLTDSDFYDLNDADLDIGGSDD